MTAHGPQRASWMDGVRLLVVLGPLGWGAGCGDVLGPGASPESVAEDPASQADAARRWQERAAAHFAVPTEVLDARAVRYRLVPPGTFLMGSPATEAGRGEDEDPYPATLLVPYYIQAAEVTWAEVRAWRKELGPADREESDEHPARGLSHQEVLEFIAWVNHGDPRWHHRLPSEAEWEHACRAGATGPWSAGRAPPSGTWAGGQGPGPRAVGRGVPNGLGLHDMHGNVAEWCRPWYGAYPASAAQLPTGLVTGTERVVRGGSWREPLAAARCAARAHLPPAAKDERVGFRLLLEAGFGVPGLGPYRLRVQTYTGVPGEAGREARPGHRVRLVSVPERLTARQEDRPIRWVELDGVTPLEIDMLPGRYYLQSWVLDGERVVRSRERKLMIPDDLPEVDVELPGS